MSDVIWNLGSDGQSLPYNDLFDALKTGVILGGSATSFSMKDGPAVAIFHGSFTLTNGVITAGTIASFQVFHNSPADELMNVSGYAINFQGFEQAVTTFSQGDSQQIVHVLFGPPLIVNGTNQPFFFEFILGGLRGDHIASGGGPDYISDLGGSDVIDGGGGDDTIADDSPEFNGIPGDDLLFGGDGHDVITAGAGNDVISGGDGPDELDGGAGSDTADYSEKLDTVAVTLNGPNDVTVFIGGFAEDILRNIENVDGGAGNDTLAGDGLNNALTGNDGDDKIAGNGGNDNLSGGDGKDKLDGATGNDRLAGGLANDIIIGGKNSDTLVFDSALDKKDNVDKVRKFSHAKDTIELDDAIFTSIDLGALKGKHLREGEKAADGNDYVIYDNGLLSYDADGKGGEKAIVFAKLKGDPNLAADDILVA